VIVVELRMSLPPFSVTWDYRCPFARIAHLHVLAGLADGADWEVDFVPFSLRQVHLADDEPDIWEHPANDSGLLALQAGIAVRDQQPDAFLAVHGALFDARHVDGRDLRERDVIQAVLAEAGADADAALQAVDDGLVLETVRKEHESFAHDHNVWGVPTFVSGDRAIFVRLMDEPAGDGALARRTIEQVLSLMTDFPMLNEFKATSIPR
jgi:hypothetical protein